MTINSQKYNNIKEVSQLNWEEIEKKVKQFMHNNCNVKGIKKDTLKLLKNQEYYPTEFGVINEMYSIPIDNYISSQAGSFITKEIIEFFGFYVNEKKYKKELEIYIDISDKILNTVEEWLNNVIDNDYFTYHFTIENDFILECLFDFDYIPNEVKNKCITSTDASLDVSLAEYGSMWRIKDNIKLIKSNYDYDNKKTYYQTLLFNCKDDILDFINEEIDNNVLDYIGEKRQKKELIKRLIHLKRNDKELFYIQSLNIINAILDYYNLGYKNTTANIPLDILIQEGIY